MRPATFIFIFALIATYAYFNPWPWEKRDQIIFFVGIVLMLVIEYLLETRK